MRVSQFWQTGALDVATLMHVDRRHIDGIGSQQLRHSATTRDEPIDETQELTETTAMVTDKSIFS